MEARALQSTALQLMCFLRISSEQNARLLLALLTRRVSFHSGILSLVVYSTAFTKFAYFIP